MTKEKIQKLIKCMDYMLLNSHQHFQDENVSSLLWNHPESILQKVFKNKIDGYETYTKDLGVWELVNDDKLWVELFMDKCDCPQAFCCAAVESSSVSEHDYVWKYVKLALKTLLQIHVIIDGDGTCNVSVQNKLHHKPNNLGVKDLKLVAGLIQLALTYGVWPNLQKGIGKPLSDSMPSEVTPSKELDHIKLSSVVAMLLTLMKNREIATQVSTLCTTDIIASLLQLGFGSLKSGTPRQTVCKHKRNSCKIMLRSFISKSYQPLIIKELLTLQRCALVSKEPRIKWFIRCIGDQLSSCLMMKNGVLNAIQAILDGLPDELEWFHYESVGKLIACVPQKLDPDEYYAKIAPQISSLLAYGLNDKNYLLAGIACVSRIFEINRKVGEKLIRNEVMEPLKRFYDTDSLAIDVSILKGCVTKLKNLVTASEENVLETIYKFIKMNGIQALFLIHTITVDAISSFRSDASEVIISTLCNTTINECVNIISLWMFGRTKSGSITNYIRSNLIINFKSENLTVNSSFSISDMHTEVKISRLLEILQCERLKTVQGDLFLHLLESMVGNLECNGRYPNQYIMAPGKEDSSLLQIDEKLDTLKYNIEIVSLISAMIDTLGHSILHNTPQIISFVKKVMDWSLNKELGEFCAVFRNNTIDLALMLLSTLLGSEKLTDSDFDILSSLVPSLKEVSHTHENGSSRAMASDIKTFITTRGAVNKPSTCSETLQLSDDDYRSKQCYEKALDDLKDPLIPTRGHALLKLSKLLRLRNPYAVCNEYNLLNIFIENLAHADTYIYLAAVDGLVSLVNVHHRMVMPALCRRFIDMRTQVLDTTASHNRMKLCEAIIKSCHLCGQLLPPYKEVLMNAFSCGVKDDDELIRASALSGIGDLCSLLRFSICGLIEEIFSCISHVVSTDQSKEVRRAGIRVFSQILKGLDVSIFTTIPEKLIDIYHLIKRIKSQDRDPTVQLHADNAIGILDGIVKDLMQPKQIIMPIQSL